MDQRSRKFDSFNEIFKKAVGINVKVMLKPRSHTYKTKQYSAWASYLIATKSYNQAPLIKDPQAEKSKTQT